MAVPPPNAPGPSVPGIARPGLMTPGDPGDAGPALFTLDVPCFGWALGSAQTSG